jgi:hypothetical protein
MDEVRELKRVDRSVRAHEAAHRATGGVHAGPVAFDLIRGPDGVLYAIGGEVSIDVSPVEGDPAATVRKMEAIVRAALAPLQPSAQDRAVAAAASSIMAQARTELLSGRNPTPQEVETDDPAVTWVPSEPGSSPTGQFLDVIV